MNDFNYRVIEADQRIRPYIKETALEFSSFLSGEMNCNIYFKTENRQVTGSFKARGALNSIIKLKAGGRNAEILTASTGNHALGIAYAIKIAIHKGTTYLPLGASDVKADLLRTSGMQVEYFGETGLDTELYVRSLADGVNKVYVSPYNDWDIIAGQGTIGMELYQQQPLLNAIFISVGGGGLISGIAGYLKSMNPGIKIIGCLPENAPSMLECIRAGKIVQVKERETLSDGTAGGVEKGAISFDLCRTLVDEFITVSEMEILQAMRLVYKHHQMVIEGAAGVAVASLLKNIGRWNGKNVAAILCGGNVNKEILNKITEHG